MNLPRLVCFLLFLASTACSQFLENMAPVEKSKLIRVLQEIHENTTPEQDLQDLIDQHCNAKIENKLNIFKDITNNTDAIGAFNKTKKWIDFFKGGSENADLFAALENEKNPKDYAWELFNVSIPFLILVLFSFGTTFSLCTLCIMRAICPFWIFKPRNLVDQPYSCIEKVIPAICFIIFGLVAISTASTDIVYSYQMSVSVEGTLCAFLNSINKLENGAQYREAENSTELVSWAGLNLISENLGKFEAEYSFSNKELGDLSTDNSQINETYHELIGDIADIYGKYNTTKLLNCDPDKPDDTYDVPAIIFTVILSFELASLMSDASFPIFVDED